MKLSNNDDHYTSPSVSKHFAMKATESAVFLHVQCHTTFNTGWGCGGDILIAPLVAQDEVAMAVSGGRHFTMPSLKKCHDTLSVKAQTIVSRLNCIEPLHEYLAQLLAIDNS